MKKTLLIILRFVFDVTEKISRFWESLRLDDVHQMFKYFKEYSNNDMQKLRLHYETRYKFREEVPTTVNSSITSFVIPIFTLLISSLISITGAIIGQSKNVTDSTEKSVEFINITVRSFWQMIVSVIGWMIVGAIVYLLIIFSLKWYSNRLFTRYKVICEILDSRLVK